MKTIIKITISLALIISQTLYSQVLEQDSLALVAFYNSTGGPSWDNNNNWLTGPVSTWHGITVEDGRVIQLHLSSNNLVGNISLEIWNLTKLNHIACSNNPELEGEISNEIGNLLDLELLGIGNCSYLWSIFLKENNLTGSIPPEIGLLDSLKILKLHANQLTGSIPPELSNCTSLRDLYLNDNQLNGVIPAELSNLENLPRLDLQDNELSGNIPESFSNFFLAWNNPNPISLDISNNQLSGNLPIAWGEMNFLINDLFLSNNNITELPQVNYNWVVSFFDVRGNRLPFEQMESHYESFQSGIYFFFNYWPQQNMLIPIDTALSIGSNYSIYSGTAGEYTYYKWFKDGELLAEGADMDTFFINNFTASDIGVYTCQATNSLLSMLTLHRNPVSISIYEDVFQEKDRGKTIQLFPNPNVGIFKLQLPMSGYFLLSVYSQAGDLCFKQSIYGEKHEFITINLKDLANGIYIFKLQNDEIHETNKIMINK